MFLSNEEKSTGSSNFDQLREGALNKSIVKLMNSEVTRSNISLKSNNSNNTKSQQLDKKTIVIKFNESFQITNSNISQNSIEEENRQLREKINSLTKEVEKYKKYFFTSSKIIKGILPYYNSHKNDDISTYQSRNQYSPNQNDSLNLSFERHQSLNEINNSAYINQNKSNISEPPFNKSKSQAINIFNKIEFINSHIKNNNVKTKHKVIDIKNENKKEEDAKKKYAPLIEIINFRKKYNIPKNITNDEIKSAINENDNNHEKAKEVLFEKINSEKK